ncbi:serine hydrolase domain-containing protein [Aureivirga marina]|uniref:serine hydrolase domain-containing protein n=1 Tax=Aureivirga marina TaxID=1182451 RepID=UPI0018CBE3E7|nr:serine hydrolase domain-containing protein [Aureivirga marina]
MKKVLLLIVAIFSIISCRDNEVKSEKIEKIDTRKQQLDSLFSKLYKNERFNGTVLIAEKGNIIFEKSYGLANEKTKDSIQNDYAFELASVSKQFTAMGIFQLWKEGKLQLEDSVSKFIPELKNYKGITIHDLLIHTGGFPDYMNLASEHWDTSKIATNEDIVKLFEKVKPELLFEPKSQFSYSNTGYLFLGTIIERASGKSFETYLKEKIFDPLEMKNTFVYRRRFQPKKLEKYAEGYIYSDSLQRKVLPDSVKGMEFFTFLDGIVGDGMVNSNVYDLLKWDRALYSDKLINEKDKKKIFSSYKTSEEKETNYGYGWKIDSSKVYGKIVSHSGGWAGYMTYIERHIDNDKTFIFLQNNSTDKNEIPIKKASNLTYGIAPKISRDSLVKVYQNYLGEYKNEEGKEKTFEIKDETLFYVVNPSFKIELIPITEKLFMLEEFSPEVFIEFISDEKGNINQFILTRPKTEMKQIYNKKEKENEV